jgi:hypothetical protein
MKTLEVLLSRLTAKDNHFSMTFPETVQRLQKDDPTERQGDYVKQETP